MKRLFLGSVALTVIASAASAADLPRKAPVFKAPPPVAYDWNGWYLGVNFGDALGQSKARTPGFTDGTADVNAKGFTVGGTLGYNWQFDPRWLVGVEGDFGWLGVNRTNIEFNDNTLVGVKTDWYGTIRGRLGYVTGPSLLYITGGAAFVHIRDTFGGDLFGVGPTEHTFTKTGWTIGGGIETKLSRAWSAKTEYLFIDAGSSAFGSNPNAGFGAVPGVPTTFDHNFHVIKTGLNYKLGEPFFEGFPLPFIGTPSKLPSDHNWNGLYAGVNVGGGISNIRTVGGGLFVPASTEQDVNGTGFAGGGQIGYNLTVWSNYFVGVEGDFGYLGIRGSNSDWNDPGSLFSSKTSWYGTARARVGSNTGPALLYFTGGGAWVHLTDTLSDGIAVTQGTRTASGWTVGGGAEVALDARWSAKIESLYIDVGHQNIGAGSFATDFKDRFTVVRAGLNYKFTD
jgi:outer membrane immunogenic protein